MKHPKSIEELLQLAKDDQPPALASVRSRVLADLPVKLPFRMAPMSIFATVSAVAAMVIMGLVLYHTNQPQDSMVELMPNLQIGSLW